VIPLAVKKEAAKTKSGGQRNCSPARRQQRRRQRKVEVVGQKAAKKAPADESVKKEAFFNKNRQEKSPGCVPGVLPSGGFLDKR